MFTRRYVEAICCFAIVLSLVMPWAQAQYDYGDAAPAYPVVFAQNGARHVISSGLCLGGMPDSEPDGLPSMDADGDGADEDGVVFLNAPVPGKFLTSVLPHQCPDF